LPSRDPRRNPFAQLLAVAREVSFIKGAELVRQGEASRGAFLTTEPAPATDPLANVPRSRHTSLEAALHGQIFRAAGQ